MAEIPVINFKLATDRDDKGQTKNYRVYAGGGQTQVKNDRGETVIKNVILGGNGTIYVANEIAQGYDDWVLIPRSLYNRLTTTTGPSRASAAAAASPKKGKK